MLVYAGLRKASKARAWSIFLVISALVFLAEGYAPFWLGLHDSTTILMLEIMHIPAAIAVIGGIHRGHAGTV